MKKHTRELRPLFTVDFTALKAFLIFLTITPQEAPLTLCQTGELRDAV